MQTLKSDTCNINLSQKKNRNYIVVHVHYAYYARKITTTHVSNEYETEYNTNNIQ